MSRLCAANHWTLLLALAVLLPTPSHAEPPPPPASKDQASYEAAERAFQERVRGAIERGVAWLEQQQNPEGT